MANSQRKVLSTHCSILSELQQLPEPLDHPWVPQPQMDWNGAEPRREGEMRERIINRRPLSTISVAYPGFLIVHSLMWI